MQGIYFNDVNRLIQEVADYLGSIEKERMITLECVDLLFGLEEHTTFENDVNTVLAQMERLKKEIYELYEISQERLSEIIYPVIVSKNRAQRYTKPVLGYFMLMVRNKELTGNLSLDVERAFTYEMYTWKY